MKASPTRRPSRVLKHSTLLVLGSHTASCLCPAVFSAVGGRKDHQQFAFKGNLGSVRVCDVRAGVDVSEFNFIHELYDASSEWGHLPQKACIRMMWKGMSTQEKRCATRTNWRLPSSHFLF
eukprot:443932-Amphidinium_carterae.1